MKNPTEIRKKADVIAYWQGRYGLGEEVVAGAYAKLGADLADFISLSASQGALEESQTDLKRQLNCDFRAGDKAKLKSSGEEIVVKEVSSGRVYSGDTGQHGHDPESLEPCNKEKLESVLEAVSCFLKAGN